MIRLIKNLIFLCFIFFVGYIFGIKEVRFVKIISSSMEPTLIPGDRVIVIKNGVLKRYDIVLIEAPEGKKEILTKRIVGLPSETIEVKDGDVYINGEKLNEPYIKEKPDYQVLKTKIPDGSYFLLGDNRNKSEDSSVWGPVDNSFIKGRIICKYWPLKEFSFLKILPQFQKRMK
ncbi:MAG: signal peptidase I [Candidatus Omnitrophica bacterium]|nr:signal peptidase I [Candidatus Omnitrophota bacterium]